MAARGRDLNVVVSREGSLSPRSRSCSASPGRRARDSFEKQVPRQVNYEDVVLLLRKWQDAKRKVGVLQKEVSNLHDCLSNRNREPTSWEISYATAKTKEKCKEFQEKMETAKRLLDDSRLESAKLSRVLVAKARKLDAVRKEAARVPTLTAAMERMLEDKSSTESALGEQGRRTEEERRRSTAWRAQVDKLSLQTVQSAERCRTLANENGELRRDLERTRELLKEARMRSAAAGGMADSLRLKSIEVGLLTEELGAVREDCGRLVQLVGSTKEYADFRRLWDESEGLTCLSNARTMSPFYATMSSSGGGLGNGSTFGMSAANQGGERVVEATEGTAPFSGEGMRRLLLGPGAAADGRTAGEAEDTSWEQAMRSEWSSPAEKILRAVAAAPPPPPPPPPPPLASPRPSVSSVTSPPDTAKATAGTSAAATTAAEGHDPEHSAQMSDRLRDQRRTESTRTRGGRSAGDVGQKTAETVSFSQGSEPPLTQALGPGKKQQEEGENASPARGRADPTAFFGASAGENVATGGCGSGGDEGSRGAAEVVRWGRVDLLSVVYPPLPAPPARQGPGKASSSDGQGGCREEFSMWVPREAAALCRRFVRDFDGYSGVPLDVEQHRLLWRLVLGLNATWRQCERKHVERLRTRYRTELAAAHRRLDMRKPMEFVVAERAAERRRPSSAPAYHSGLATVVPATRNNPRRPREWGTDGRRVRPGAQSGRGSPRVGVNCGRSGSSGSTSGGARIAGRGKTLRTKGRGGERTAVGAGGEG